MPTDMQMHTRVMAISHAEFLRSLQPLKKYYQFKIEDDGKLIVINDDQRVVNIRLGEEGCSVIGALQMPSTRVELTFSGFSSFEKDRFWSRFDLCFRRGGG